MKTLAGLPLMLLGLLTAPAAALTYVNSSPSGAQFPQWDGGNSELEFADLDGDGNVDLISIGDHGNPYIGTQAHGIMVYFADGAGGWSIHQEGSFGYGGIAAGDVNNDGLLDVGYGMHHNYSGSDFGDQLIEVALGDGTGTGWTPWDDGLAANGEDWGMGATDFADFDNDGLLDLVSLSFGCCNGVRVYRNNGDGSWTQTYALTGGNAYGYVATGDVNGDGNADFAASYQYGCVFLGDGHGGFTSGDTGLPGRDGLSLGDVDGDGCKDIAFTSGGRPHVAVWRGDHWEQASAGLPASGSYEATELCDMNSDGVLDLVATGDGACTVWLGDGGGAWAAAGGFTAPSANEVAAFRAGGDFDHNGFPDVALVQEEGDWINYRNYLYVYRESSLPSARFVRGQSPRSHETICVGSAQRLRWTAARMGTDPATIRLEISYSGPAGPWHEIASGLPDNGCHQWTASGPSTANAFLKTTLTQGGETVSDLSGPFSLVSPDPTAANGPAASGPQLSVRPHPMTRSARLLLAGAESDGWTLRIHDAAGRLVRTLDLAAGRAEWDGRDLHGVAVPSGVYLARAQRAGGVGAITRSIVLLR